MREAEIRALQGGPHSETRLSPGLSPLPQGHESLNLRHFYKVGIIQIFPTVENPNKV